MPTSARLALLLLLLVAPAPHAARDADDTSPFLVAVLRRDGLLIPFAAFDGKDWTAPWPQSVLRSPGAGFKEPPKDLQSVPRDWWGKTGTVTDFTAWANGVILGPIHVHLGQVALVHVMCDRRFGLASDYKSSQEKPPNTIQPHPKDGIAVSGGQRVEPIQVLTAESPEWAAASREMTADFDEAEERAAHTFLAWKHPFNKVERRRYRPQIEAMYGAPMDEPGWTAYYLEAVRVYPPGPDDRGCGLVTSAGGWMLVGPDGKRSFRLDARIAYCDRQGMLYMLPLGLIKARDRSYWVYQMSGYGREGYLIGRPRPKETVTELQYTGGTCPF